MTEAIFDSHQFAQRLMQAGVSAQAADVHAEMMVMVMTEIAAFSGKLDRQGLKIDLLHGKIDTVEAKLDNKIDTVNANLGNKIDTGDARLDAKIDIAMATITAHIATTKTDLIRWMASLGVLQLTLISALLLKLTP